MGSYISIDVRKGGFLYFRNIIGKLLFVYHVGNKERTVANTILVLCENSYYNCQMQLIDKYEFLELRNE